MDCGELGSAAWHPFSRWPASAPPSSPISGAGQPEGEKPAELPVMQAIKFELVINTQTAKTLSIDPPGVLVI
jgi:hypothetical protein